MKVFKSGDCLDIWWNYIFKSDRYSCLPKVVKAALSIFIGLQIEISFSMMNNNIDKCSSCMDMGAIMNIKYDLIAKGHSSFQECHCKNIYDPVNTVLGYHMHSANFRYTERVQKKQKKTRSCCSIDQILHLKKYAKRNEVQNKELVKENLKDQRWYTIK